MTTADVAKDFEGMYHNYLLCQDSFGVGAYNLTNNLNIIKENKFAFLFELISGMSH
jgi:hypothetical protein